MTYDRRSVQRPSRPEYFRRDKAVSREISPCSEYTRFTAEGRFKDPFSDNSVILDSEGMSVIFQSGPFEKPKWSKRLGYGMAVIDGETRVHIHANGKFVIRRAADRSHAEHILRTLSLLSKPNIYSTEDGRFLWEIVRDMSFKKNADLEEGLDKLFGWEENKDPKKIAERAVSVFREIDEDMGMVLDEHLDNNDQLPEKMRYKGLSLTECIKKELSGAIKGRSNDPGTLLGLSSYLILASLIFDIS